MPQSVAEKLVGPRLHGGEVFQVARRLGVDPGMILDFSASINPLGPPRSAIRRIRASLGAISHYPDPEYFDLRKAIAGFVGLGDYENVIEGNGSTDLIHHFAGSSMAPGDRVVIPVPAFAEYARAAKKSGGIPVYVPCREDFVIDSEAVMEEIDRGCRLLFLASPGNPSSRVTPSRELLRMTERAAEKGARVLLDEAFAEFTSEGGSGLAGRVGEFPNLLVLRSLTKVFALAGLRIGYGVASSKLVSSLREDRIPWAVNLPAQEAVIAAVKDGPFIERSRALIAAERAHLYSGLDSIGGLEPVRPDANFILVKLTGGIRAGRLKDALLRDLILIRDCSSFEGLDDGYFRVCVRLRAQNERLLSAIRRCLA